MSCVDPLRPLESTTFVSSTFSIAVAREFFVSGDEVSVRVLYQQTITIKRLFMTFYETEPMNKQFREAEAILLYGENNLAFLKWKGW